MERHLRNWQNWLSPRRGANYQDTDLRERGAETQAEGEAGSMHREPDVGFDPGSPGSHPGPKAGAKPLRHPGSRLPLYS